MNERILTSLWWKQIENWASEPLLSKFVKNNVSSICESVLEVAFGSFGEECTCLTKVDEEIPVSRFQLLPIIRRLSPVLISNDRTYSVSLLCFWGFMLKFSRKHYSVLNCRKKLRFCSSDWFQETRPLQEVLHLTCVCWVSLPMIEREIVWHDVPALSKEFQKISIRTGPCFLTLLPRFPVANFSLGKSLACGHQSVRPPPVKLIFADGGNRFPFFKNIPFANFAFPRRKSWSLRWYPHLDVMKFFAS